MRKGGLLLALLVLGGGLPGTLFARGQIPLSVPLYVAPERLSGDVRVRIDGASVVVEKATLLPLLERLLTLDVFARVSALPTTDGFLTLAGLEAAGFTFSFDQSRVALLLTLVPDQQKTAVVSLLGPGGPGSGTPVALARQNTILTLHGRALNISEVGDTSGRETGWEPFTLNLQAAQRFGQLGNFVIEGDGFFQDRSETPWQRGGVRALYDLPDDAVRLSVGDVLAPTTGFQGNGNFAGIGINRSFTALQPERVIRPTGSQSFLLDRRSTIDVYVNNVRTRQIILDPGRYTLTDLVFVSGASSVRLEITDDAGNRQSLSFDAFSDPNLLKAGITDFGLNAGMVARPEATSRTYDSGDMVSTSFVRYGLTDALTVGANLQTRSREDRTLAGGDVAFGTPVGIWSLAAARSTSSTAGQGTSATLGYTFETNRDSGSNDSFEAAFTTTDADFADVFTETPSNTIARDTNLRWRHFFPDGRTVSLSGRYGVGRDETPDQWDNTASFGKGMLIGRVPVSAQVSLSANDTQGDGATYGVFLSLSVNFGDSGQVLGSFNSVNDSATAAWYGQTGYGVETFSGRGTVRRDNESGGADGAVRYQGNRMNVGLEHRLNLADHALDRRGQQTGFDFETSLVQADGRLGWGRPVYDSFALVAANPNLKGHSLSVNRTEYGARAVSDGLGAPVFGELWSYRPSQITVDAEDLPPGYALPETVFVAQPAYRSAVIVPFGSDANLSATGQLVGADGTPVAFAAGEATPLDSPGTTTLPFFTNRNGRFALQGLTPGGGAFC